MMPRAARTLQRLTFEGPQLALFGPDRPGSRRLFLRVERTAELRARTSEFDPVADSAGRKLMHCEKLTGLAAR